MLARGAVSRHSLVVAATDAVATDAAAVFPDS